MENSNQFSWRDLTGPTLSLFFSTSTLLCCALPAVLISVGAGAVMAGLTSIFPGIIWLSSHKIPLFILTGLVLVTAGSMSWFSRGTPCPVDPERALSCLRLRRGSQIILATSAALYAVAGFYAFIWPLWIIAQ